MRAASSHQGSFLCESLCQRVWLTPATELAVAKGSSGAGSPFVLNKRPSLYNSPAPPASVETVFAEDDAPQLGHHFLANGHLGEGKEAEGPSLKEPLFPSPLSPLAGSNLPRRVQSVGGSTRIPASP